jgi:hypothetical protein
MKKIIIPCVAIIVIGILGAIALFKGIDGVLFGGVVTIIGGIAGYTIQSKKDK